MKKLSLLCAMALVLAALCVPQAYGAGVNITTWDGMTSGADPWYDRGQTPAGEQLEVEPNCVPGADWDLQAFSITKETGLLATIGTYKFLGTTDGWKSGDIFISTSGAPKYGPDVSGYNYNGAASVTNVFGYNYVLKMNWVTNKFDIYALNGASTLKVYYGQNQGSNPYAYDTGGTLKKSGLDFTVTSRTAEYIQANYGVTLDPSIASSNVVLTNISDIWGGTLLWTHFTQECGNDDLMGNLTGSPVPVPASVLLLGTGLLGLAGLGWRRRKTNV